MPRISLLQVPNAPNVAAPAMGPQLGQLATPTPLDPRGGMVETASLGRAQANLGSHADHIQRGARVGAAAMEQGKQGNVRPEMFAGAGYGIGAVGEAMGQAGKAMEFFADRMMQAKETTDKARVDGTMRDTLTGFWQDIQKNNIPETEWVGEFNKRTPEMRKRIADLKISPRIASEVEAEIIGFESRHVNDVAMKATKQSLDIAKGTVLNAAQRAFLAGDTEKAFGFIEQAEQDGLLRTDEAESEMMKYERLALNENIAFAINQNPEAVAADLEEAKRTGKSQLFPDLQPTEIQKLHGAAVSQVRQSQVLVVEEVGEGVMTGKYTTPEQVDEALDNAKVQVSEKDRRSLKNSLAFEQAQTPEAIAKYQQFYGMVMDEVAGYDARQDPTNEKYLQILRTIRERVEPGEREWLLRDLNSARTEGRKPNADIQANLFRRIEDLSKANAFGDPKKIFDRKGEVKDWDAYMSAQQRAVTLRGQVRGWLEQNPGATEAQAFDYFKTSLGSEVADNVVFSLLGEKPEVAPVPQNNPRSRQPRQQQQSITPESIDTLLRGGEGATAPTGKKEPAAIRHNNPGAMWFAGGWQEKYGAQFGQKLNDGLKQGNQIATFPDAVSGAAAQLDLLVRYGDRSVKEAVTRWSGGNNVNSYLAVLKSAGFKPTEKLPDIMADPEKATRFARAMARHEAGKDFPLDEQGWMEAYNKMREVRGDQA